MKIFEKRNTSEVKSRRRRFFAFCLVLIISMLPAATVFAKTIELGYLLDMNPNNYPGEYNHVGDPVEAGDKFVAHSGNIQVTYGNETWGDPDVVNFQDGDLDYTIQSKTKDGKPYSSWRISQQRLARVDDSKWLFVILAPNADPVDTDQPDNPVNPTPSPSQKDDNKKEDKKDTGSSEKKKHSQSPTSWEGNPDEITAFYFKNGVMDPKAKFGKQEQGAACKAAFDSALPAGYKQAFTFSMSVDGRHTTDLKDGIIKMYVPSSFQKAGRQFAIMAIDKNAIVHIYNDSDPQVSVIASQLIFEGYAFCLIYKD
ncbi:MAG: hypothetical protein IJU43_08335 [Lachnospiraceae bacterium]|nr:hypothetical protein [Lachnospiraceae bacterium]